MCAKSAMKDTMDNVTVKIDDGSGKVVDMKLRDFSTAARRIAESVRIAPADSVGDAAAIALGMVQNTCGADGDELGLSERLVCAVLLEYGMRHGAYLVDMCRRELSKFLEDPESEVTKFVFGAGLRLEIACLPGENGFVLAPAVVSKIGSAKVPMRSLNRVCAQLELFAPASEERGE
jgi:hypothetical protein